MLQKRISICLGRQSREKNLKNHKYLYGYIDIRIRYQDPFNEKRHHPYRPHSTLYEAVSVGIVVISFRNIAKNEISCNCFSGVRCVQKVVSN